MSIPNLPELQDLLLDLCMPRRMPEPAALAALQPADWDVLAAMAREQRLSPWLHWQLSRAPASLPVPAAVRDALAEEFRRATLRSLRLQAELVRLHRLLKGAQVDHIVLKGAFLAFHAYPHPALRPMRDIDVLVAPEQVLRAYEMLQAAGLRRKERLAGDAHAASEAHHHLPGLMTQDGVVVELHNRLLPPRLVADGRRDLRADDSFWSRARTATFGSEQIQVESPEDLLLHLIVHACVQHEFDNGPLFLCDLAFLLIRHEVDWSRFWAMAREGGQVRACLLSLQLAQRGWDVPVTWPDDLPEDERHLAPSLLQAAGRLMLRDPRQRRAVVLGGMLAAAPTAAQRARLLWRKTFVSRQTLAAEFPVSAESPLVWAWYPVRWGNRLRHYVIQFRRLRQHQAQDEMREMGRVRRWLTE